MGATQLHELDVRFLRSFYERLRERALREGIYSFQRDGDWLPDGHHGSCRRAQRASLREAVQALREGLGGFLGVARFHDNSAVCYLRLRGYLGSGYHPLLRSSRAWTWSIREHEQGGLCGFLPRQGTRSFRELHDAEQLRLRRVLLPLGGLPEPAERLGRHSTDPRLSQVHRMRWRQQALRSGLGEKDMR